MRSCRRLTSLRASPARASPTARTPSCSTRRCPASGCASTRRAARSGSYRPASRGGAAASSSPGMARWTSPKRAAAPATCSHVSARAITPQTTSSARGRPRRCGSSRTSICGAANRTGSPRGAGPCASTSRPASCPRSAGCRSTASAPRTWPRGSTRPAGTSPARPTAPWRYYARCCFGPRNGDCASAAPTPVSGLRRTRGTTLPGSSTRTSWPGSGARSTPTRPAGPRPSPPSGCWRSPVAAAAKCSIYAGATSAKTRSGSAIRRPARAPCRSARPRGRSSRRCPARATRTRICFRAMPKAGASGFSRIAGARSVRMRSSAGYACTIFVTPPRAKPSCRARTCPWWGC